MWKHLFFWLALKREKKKCAEKKISLSLSLDRNQRIINWGNYQELTDKGKRLPLIVLHKIYFWWEEYIISLGLLCQISCPNPLYFIFKQCYMAPNSTVLLFWNIPNMTKNTMSFICCFSHISKQFTITQFSSRSTVGF